MKRGARCKFGHLINGSGKNVLFSTKYFSIKNLFCDKNIWKRVKENFGNLGSILVFFGHLDSILFLILRLNFCYYLKF